MREYQFLWLLAAVLNANPRASWFNTFLVWSCFGIGAFCALASLGAPIPGLSSP